MDFAARMGIPEWEFRLIFGRTRIEYDPKPEEAQDLPGKRSGIA